MPKASPMIRSFNAGEFSALLSGRTDLDRYPASMKRLFNMVAAPQGPAISRSGTAFVTPVNDNAQFSALVPFVFSDEQALMLEFSDDRIRFISEDGLQVYAGVVATMTSIAGAVIKFTSATLGAAIGDQVIMTGFPANYNLNSVAANITNKVGTTYTLDVVLNAALAVVNFTASRVYHVALTYTEAQRRALRYVQSVDVIYLLTGSRPIKLSRYDAYDWRIASMVFKDGPYMPINETDTTLSPSATGNVIPDMTSNGAPSGVCGGGSTRPHIAGTPAVPVDFNGRLISYDLPASQFWYGFDNNDSTYWAGAEVQTGNLEYAFGGPVVVDGYTIYAALDNQDPDYLAKDFAPSTWAFQGWNGAVWGTIDEQTDYVLYDGSKSVFFKIDQPGAYSKYRIVIFKLYRNGLIEPRIRRLVMRTATSASINLTASSTIGLNGDVGFMTADIGRLIRLRGTDGAWRAATITAALSPTVVTVTLAGDPLLNTKPIKTWRMGYWSNNTGWPTVGTFFEDRLWLAGPKQNPDMFAGSVTGAYDDFRQTDEFGVVQDDSAVVLRLNSRKLAPVRWISSDTRGLLMGTGSEEYVVSAPNDQALTARTAKARPATRRGSAFVEPVRIDNQLLYVQRSGRTIREFAFVFETDGYKSPSMSQLASHMGRVAFAEMDYAAEPHSIVWCKRSDGSVVGLTYNREENVIGWHTHDFSVGVVESLAVIPAKDQLQDTLWMVIKRTINGVDKRYIERLTRFWDFDTTIADAHFVDSGLRYVGSPIDIVYGLQHLEGKDVYGLADGRRIGPLTVTNGSVTLLEEASNVVLGLGYDSEAETSDLENGAADGTAQGKVKRTNSIVVSVWASVGGEVGVNNTEQNDGRGGPVYEPLEYPQPFDDIQVNELYTGMLGPITPEPGYSMKGSMFFRRPKESPLPFNVVAIMPQLNTQDR